MIDWRAYEFHKVTTYYLKVDGVEYEGTRSNWWVRMGDSWEAVYDEETEYFLNSVYDSWMREQTYFR